jgi:hypothetical protein
VIRLFLFFFLLQLSCRVLICNFSSPSLYICLLVHSMFRPHIVIIRYNSQLEQSALKHLAVYNNYTLWWPCEAETYFEQIIESNVREENSQTTTEDERKWLTLIPEDGGDVFLRNVNWFATDYAALYLGK